VCRPRSRRAPKSCPDRADDGIAPPQPLQCPELSRRADREQHGHSIARLVTADDSQPGDDAKFLERGGGLECFPVFFEAPAVETIEVHQTCRGEPATLEVGAETAGQRFADRATVPPEFGGDHEVAQEPLEEHALHDAFIALEALGIAARELFLLEPCPEDVGAADDAFGEGPGDAGRRRADVPIAAS